MACHKIWLSFCFFEVFQNTPDSCIPLNEDHTTEKITMKVVEILAALVAIMTSGSAVASLPVPVSEPSVLGLLAAGGAVGAIVAIRVRRK